MLASFLAGWRAGAIALILAELMTSYVVVPPQRSLLDKTFSDLFGLSLVTFSCVLILILTQALRRSARILEAERNRQDLLNQELAHRVKNTLASVQAMALQTFGTVPGAKSAMEQFEGRLLAMSSAHELLTRHGGVAANLKDIVADAMTPFQGPHVIIFEGPEILLGPQQALAIAMALHELSTNAVKYGALSVQSGSLQITWSREDDRWTLCWREAGGPPMKPPKTSGFGTRLLQRNLARQLEGRVNLAFQPSGLVCEIEAPLGGHGERGDRLH
jgi:two-component sensor histidine kinase